MMHKTSHVVLIFELITLVQRFQLLSSVSDYESDNLPCGIMSHIAFIFYRDTVQ